MHIMASSREVAQQHTTLTQLPVHASPGSGYAECGRAQRCAARYHLYPGARPRTSLAVPHRIFSHSTQFSGKEYHRSSKAARGEDLEVEEPVSCWGCSA